MGQTFFSSFSMTEGPYQRVWTKIPLEAIRLNEYQRFMAWEFLPALRNY